MVIICSINSTYSKTLHRPRAGFKVISWFNIQYSIFMTHLFFLSRIPPAILSHIHSTAPNSLVCHFRCSRPSPAIKGTLSYRSRIFGSPIFVSTQIYFTPIGAVSVVVCGCGRDTRR
ncbi:uncharacterized protein F5147DRAFT_676227 [Suillus discolor]|uniref:Uncharacterized protein n=1 Tax=Suillus discolor TaxID=1912936 RepID=A0A9P7FFI3_9AGAM|nr:uncharacterized protein F5147DRAFT_676227 [Suillus discolor]KAG2115088.1 hypothetical protein F5147DRAFT_676227 [Suillus discolor]